MLIRDVNFCCFPIIFSPLWTDLIYNCRLLKNKRERRSYNYIATTAATYIAIWHTVDNDRLQKTLVWVRLLFRNFLRLEKTTFEISDAAQWMNCSTIYIIRWMLLLKNLSGHFVEFHLKKIGLIFFKPSGFQICIWFDRKKK